MKNTLEDLMDELEETRKLVLKEIFDLLFIEEISDSSRCPMLKVIQPPTSVLKEIAEAATAVLMAFERGYRMG
jgi:hypothetical protein